MMQNYKETFATSLQKVKPRDAKKEPHYLVGNVATNPTRPDERHQRHSYAVRLWDSAPPYLLSSSSKARSDISLYNSWRLTQQNISPLSISLRLSSETRA